jgi:hypothetical protein
MTITGFVLRLANDERVFVNLDMDNLNDFNQRLSNAERISIGDLLRLGSRVGVMTVGCGSGSFEYADSIRLVGATPSRGRTRNR